VVRRRKRKIPIVALALGACVAAATFLVLRRQSSEPSSILLPRDCPLGPTTSGIDVSYYQGDIGWDRVARAGVKFAFIRAYDGTAVFDGKFVANWQGAAQAKVLRGPYQYFRPELSPIDQADVLIRALRTHGTGELPPVLDVETTSGLTLDVVAQRAAAWVERVRTELKVEPLVYTNYGMWRWRPATEIATQPLWLAHYTTGCPMVPAPWVRWTFWQYTDNGRVPGISGAVDLDVFDGTVEDLRRRF
jgi:lysozyme